MSYYSFGKFDFVKLGYEMQNFSTTLEGWVLKVFNFIYIIDQDDVVAKA